MLLNFPDKDLVDLLDYGWPLDYTSTQIPVPTYENHSKDEDDVIHIETFIAKKLNHSAMFGPFESAPFKPWLQCSPIMTRPKKNSLDKRIIIDLSFPRGRSVSVSIVKGFYLGKNLISPYLYFQID